MLGHLGAGQITFLTLHPDAYSTIKAIAVPGGRSCRHDVTVVEARCPHNPLTRPARNRLLEDGTGINKRVILAVLTTWVGIVRKIAQQLIINFSAGERGVYGLRIDAGEDRLESQPNEGPHKLVGVAHPDRI